MATNLTLSSTNLLDLVGLQDTTDASYPSTATVTCDLVDATGLTVSPAQFHVQRWPGAIPQLEVGHLDRVASVRQDLRRFPGLTLAGASYDGLGITACVRSGELAAMS